MRLSKIVTVCVGIGFAAAASFYYYRRKSLASSEVNSTEEQSSTKVDDLLDAVDEEEQPTSESDSFISFSSFSIESTPNDQVPPSSSSHSSSDSLSPKNKLNGPFSFLRKRFWNRTKTAQNNTNCRTFLEQISSPVVMTMTRPPNDALPQNDNCRIEKISRALINDYNSTVTQSPMLKYLKDNNSSTDTQTLALKHLVPDIEKNFNVYHKIVAPNKPNTDIFTEL